MKSLILALFVAFFISLAFGQNNEYPTAGDVTTYNSSPLLILKNQKDFKAQAERIKRLEDIIGAKN